MAQFTAREQLMLELINRARMDPAAEAARYGIDINEGASPAINSTPKQVLAGSDELGKAADKHSKWMTFNGMSHSEGANTAYFYGAQPDDRIERAGYTNWRIWGENIAYRSGSSLDATQTIYDLHQALFVDSGVFGRGHRVNLMNGEFSEIGIGNKTGTGAFGMKSSYITQDFADAQGSVRFITGVVYDDTVTRDDFFTVGEQTAARAVSVANSTNTDVTGAGGGYELAFARGGSKTLTFDLAGDDLTVKVDLAGSNVKVDAVNGREIWTNGSLTSLSDAIKELHALGIEDVNLKGSGASEKIYGNSGDNSVAGGGGNDSILGSSGEDTLTGGSGNDTIFGGNGRDTQTGGSGDDQFDFRKASHSPVSAPDTIKDFDASGDDTINLKDVFVGTLFYRGEAPIADAGEVHVSASGNDVVVSINIDPDLAPEMVILLKNTNLAAMSAEDFIL
ncbi:MAG: CAP domain-containing protein [Devosia sp.]